MSSMDADDDGDEKSTTTFRWISVARYAVATVVTVLIATVVVIAIKMVVRPDTLRVTVIGGSIRVERQTGLLQFQLQVEADNLSGRAVMYYYNITGYLFDKNISASTLHPQDDCFVALKISDMALQQQTTARSTTNNLVPPDIMTRSYFDMLYTYRSSRIDGVTLRMDGDLVTQPISGYNTTSRSTTYLCSPLVVGTALATTTGGGQDDDETQGSVVCEMLNSTVTSAR